MPLSTRQQSYLLFIFKIMVISAGIGVSIALLRQSDGVVVLNLIEGALMGILIGLGCTLSETLTGYNERGSLVSRLPIAVIVLIRAVSFSFFILVGLNLPIWLFSGVLWWRDPNFTVVFLICIFIASLFAIIIEVARLLGKEATVSLLTGRYRRPRLENRIVLFADLVGSTALAERIGDLRFHAFLSDVAHDLSDPVEQARGDVHRYVGDAVIVTWRQDQRNAPAAALTCAAEMHSALASAADSYRDVFGSAPKLRIAIHCGPLAAGEIGDWKKEIALLGDTMNTAARIESAARDLSVVTAVSDDMVRLLPDHARATLTLLPGYTANGKRAPLTLWGVKLGTSGTEPANPPQCP